MFWSMVCVEAAVPARQVAMAGCRHALTAAGLLTVLCLAPAQAQTQTPLALDQAMALAEARSQALPAQQAAARAASERAVAAGQRPDPVLRLGLDNVPIEGNARSLLTREPTTARSIGIVQALPDMAKRQARSQRYRQDALWASARREAARAEVRRETALAWLALRAEQDRLMLLAAMQAEASRIAQAAEAAYRAGQGDQAGVFSLRALAPRLADQQWQVQARLENARSMLARWIGPAANGPLAEAPPWRTAAIGLAGTDTGADTGTSDGLAWLADEPSLRAAAARADSARAMAEQAREDARSDWSIDLRFQQRGPRFDNMVTIGLSRPLRWDPGNRQDREVAARLAETEQAEAEAEELRRARVADVQRWQQRWRSGLARLNGYDAHLLPLAASGAEAALAAYRAGSGGLVAVLQARQAELALRLERVQIELETASDWARLVTLIPPPEAAR